MNRRWHVVGWFLLAAAAVLLWPERWGGTMTYVITSGSSMEPTFVQGDLAVLRQVDEYRVGDVVAYESDKLRQIVMHRIVERTPDGFVFQGDANDFVDPETVDADDLLGRLAVRVPGIGRFLAAFLTPVNLALAAGAVYLLLGDRRPPETKPASPAAAVHLQSLEMPTGCARASLTTEEELAHLAERLGRPVLVVADEPTRYVVDGTLVYFWRPPALEEGGRRRTPQGRDWNYANATLRLVPADADGRLSA